MDKSEPITHSKTLPIFLDIFLKEANYENPYLSELDTTTIITNLVRISIDAIIHLRYSFFRIYC